MSELDVPKIQAASRTLLTHLRFDPSEAGRCCLDSCIFDLMNKTPAAFQESTTTTISPGIHGWKGRNSAAPWLGPGLGAADSQADRARIPSLSCSP